MSDINVRVVGTANLAAMKAPFDAFEAQIVAVNAELARMVTLTEGVDGRGFERMSRAANYGSKAFRNAAASTGMFEVQQVKVNRATDDYIKKLRAQQMSFKELRKARDVGHRAFLQQMAMEKMMVAKQVSSVSHGKDVMDVMYPKTIAKNANFAAQEMAFMNEQMRSGAKQMINWGKNTQWAGRQLTVGLTMPVLAFGAAAGVMAYQVDKELTRVAKVYDTTADATSVAVKDQMAVEKELMDLREAGTNTAIKAANEYGAAATDTLDVQAELAATGIKGAALQERTAEVMRIARLGEIDHQSAIQATIALQSVFRMSTNELTESFNFMNAVENATSLATADFAAAIPIAAAPIKQFGGDIQELGILLTAMKERGIEATQGANAIKAAMQRLGRPSKQIQEEFTAMTGADITQIFDKSKNLTEIFTKINEVTKDLSKQDKTKVFAGLFGSYQVTRMGALVEGMDDLQNGVGQVSTAFELSKKSTKSWADTADREMKRYQESISGQFDIALQSIKIELKKFGEPFLQVATVIVKGLTGVMKMFDQLPGVVKIFVGIGIAAAALAGPILMMIGLFANLGGQGLTALAKVRQGFKLMTAEERAAEAASEMHTAQLTEQYSETQLLTMAIEAQTNAMREQHALMAQKYPAGSVSPVLSSQVSAPVNTGTMYGPRPPTPTELKAAERSGGKSLTIAKENLAVEKKRSGALAASAGWIALGTASMLVQSSSASENTKKAAQWAMYASMIVPALIMAVQAARGFYAWMAAAAVATESAAVGATWLTVATTAAGRAAAFAGMAFKFMFGPIGLAIMGITAIALILYKLWKDHREAQKEAWRNQMAITNATEQWAENAGKARKEYERIKVVGLPEQGDYRGQFEEDYKYYTETDTGKASISAIDSRSEAEQDRIAMKMLIDLQYQYGLSAERAKVNVAAMFTAAGYGADQARFKVDELDKQIGGLGDRNWDDILKNAGQAFIDATKDSRMDLMSDEGQESNLTANAFKLGETFSAAFSRGAGNPVQEGNIFRELETVTMSRWEDLLTKMKNSGTQAQKWLKENGIDNAKELSQFYRKTGKDFSFESGPMMGVGGILQDEFDDAAAAADHFEAKIIGAIASSNHLNKNITTTAELQYDVNILAGMLSYKQAVKQVKEFARTLLAAKGAALGMDVSKGFYNLTQNQQNAQRFHQLTEKQRQDFDTTMKAFAQANNIKEGKNALQTYYNILNNVKNKTDDTKNATKAWGQAMKYTAEEINGVRQEAMSGVTQDIADDIESAFDDRMESALEARQNMWDRRADALAANIEQRQNALENEFDKRERAMDAKWEAKTDAAEKYWDRRTEAVEKAIEVEQKAEENRQKMFDAEIARINKLNEMYNRNIDFNVAISTGKFDEAAKIRNDATADAATTALERAKAAGTAGSERRIGRLEDRKDSIDKAREKFMKDLEKREEAEKRHLARLREMRERALDRQSERQTKHLENMTDADMEAQNEIWENRKESLQEQLELFTSFIARNEKELRQHMKDVGLSYEKFGKEVLKPKGENWATYFGERMKVHIRKAGNELRSDKMWEALGKDSVNSMLKGMGFKDMAAFKHFVKTGEWKGNGNKSGGANKNGGPTPTGDLPDRANDKNTGGRHEGGEVGGGKGKDSRKGVARTLKGLHQNEQMIRAQKGEYVVNKKSTEQNRGLLERINSGSNLVNDSHASNLGWGGKSNTGGAGGLTGPAAAMSGIMSALFLAGAHKALQRKKDDKQAELAAQARASGGTWAAGKAGMYSDRSFSVEQLRNAATIASIGSKMGMSKRDIEIGIMTAITESGLINIHGGDRDSQGLFQQRPSQGWGTVAQVTDPEYAAHKFFSVLKNVTGRESMSPWMAAQSVQRSAYSDGSNYRQYWDNAIAIYNKGLTKSAAGAGFVQGVGGKHRPVGGAIVQGIHDAYTGYPAVDLDVPNPPSAGAHPVVRAAADGRVSRSYDLVGNDGRVSNGGYYSYGRVIYIDHGGFETLYAHLNDRYARAGQQVKGGAVIGRAGNTGHSYGDHLHFGAKGISPYAFLKKGAANVNFDNTIANLHKGEAVLTKDLNRKFHEGVDRFAEGPSTVYDVDVHVEGTNASIDDITKAVTTALKKADAKKPQPRRQHG